VFGIVVMLQLGIMLRVRTFRICRILRPAPIRRDQRVMNLPRQASITITLQGRKRCL
jgi:hypothetical protein